MKRQSRTKIVLSLYVLLTGVCLAAGAILGKPFDLQNSIAVIPFVGWYLGKRNRDKHIFMNPVFQAQKWSEPQFISGLIPSTWPFLAWLLYLVFSVKVEVDPLTLVSAGSIIGMIIAANQGGDKNKLPKNGNKEKV
jgi:hypothetical protein